MPPSSSQQLSLGIVQKTPWRSLGCPGFFRPPCCWFLPGHGCSMCMPSRGLEIACGVAVNRESLLRGGAAAGGSFPRPPPYGLDVPDVAGPCRSGGGEGEPLGDACGSQLLARELRASQVLSKGYKRSPAGPAMASGPSEASPAPAPPPAAWPCWREMALGRGLLIL